MLTIAVDAMGGDHAPKREVEGAIRAAEELQIGVILVGLEDVLRAELALYPQAGRLPIEVQRPRPLNEKRKSRDGTSRSQIMPAAV